MDMEDGDASSTNPNSIASLLYCDEGPLVSTPPPPPPPEAKSASVAVVAAVQDAEKEQEDLKELLVDHMDRQRFYAPAREYLEHLQQQQTGVSAARSRGAHYIIYAFGRLGLTAATAFNAVNYLDRFLSINCHLCWEAWMVELVSVSCLSIACKLDEVNIPLLHHLQMEEVMSHSFLPATVRDMELTLLKALQWRLACVTPYSFLQLLLPLTRTTATAASRCTRLLVHSLAEPSLIKYDSSVIASSALRCVSLEDHHHQTYIPHYIDRFIRSEFPKDKEVHDECFRMMQTLYESCSDPSPILMIPFETHGDSRVNRSSASRRRLFGASLPQDIGIQDNDTDDRDEDISHTADN